MDQNNSKTGESLFDNLYDEVPSPGSRWVSLSSEERKSLIYDCLGVAVQSRLSVASCEDGGYVYFDLIEPISAAERGEFLLNIEQQLKTGLDAALTVWLRPQGDKSSLRRLRGVVVKK